MKAAGTSVREIREAAEISLRELQERTLIHRATWSRIENGTMLPEPQQLAALSEALGVPFEEWRIRFVLERKAS